MPEASDARSTGVAIGVLGPLTVHRDGRRIVLGGRREAAVLVSLLLDRDRVVSTDALVDAIWPDAKPAQPQPTLQAHVSHLRRRLDPDGTPGRRAETIERVGPGYALRLPADAVDAWRFERLVNSSPDRHGQSDGTDGDRPADQVELLTGALSLWRGAALAGFADEDWARPTAERWTEMHSLARERLFSARLDRGEGAALVPDLEAFVAGAPLREERWRLLALALYRAHRQADALAALRRVRSLLADELGVDPGPALRSLEAEILSQSSTLDAAPRVQAGTGSVVLPAVEPGSTSNARLPNSPTGGTADTTLALSASVTPGTTSATAASAAQHEEPPAAVSPLSPITQPQPSVPSATSAAPSGVSPTPSAATGTALADGTSIVERDRELASVQAAVRSAMAGDGRVVLIEGPAGIGKTRLLREVRINAGSARVLSARGSQLEREYGFGVIRQLFEPAMAGADPEVLFAGAAGTARSVFAVHPDSAGPAGDTTFGVLHGLYWLTANLAAGTALVITVDDVQWCDVGSLRFLGFLAHRLEGLPIALVVTLRTGELHDNDELLAEIVSEAGVLVVTPRPLSSAGVDELVRERLGDDPDEAFVAACRRTTGGNPLLLRQLLRALESDGIRPTTSNVDTVRAIGSRAVSSLVLRRFTRMPAENRAAARAIAVLGDGATIPLVAELTELPQSTIAAAIGSLARAEVLRHEYPLDFVHPLVRDAVYGDIPLGTREMQHEQAGRLLAASGAAAERIAAHLLKSPPRGDPRSVEILLAAASRSVIRGAPDGAATYLKRALAEPPGSELEPGLLLELGRVEALTDVPAALEHLTAALARLTDVRERAQAAVLLGRVEIFAGPRGDSRRTVESIIDQLAPEDDDERQWLQAISRVSAHMHVLGAPQGPPPSIIGTGPGALSLATTLAWETTLAGVDRERAVDLARFALTSGVLDDVDQGFMGAVARNVLQVAEAAPAHQWDDALAKALRKGSLFAVLAAQVWGGYAHLISGDLEEALQRLRNCTEQNDLWGAHQIGQTYTDAFLIDVLLDIGDLAAAQALVDSSPPYWRVITEGHALVLTGRARVLAHTGRLEESLAVLDRVAELSDGIFNPAWRTWKAERAVVLGALGRAPEALELLEDDLRLARRWGTSRGIGRTLRMLGTIRGGADGADELRAAVTTLERSPARLEFAKAQAALGELLLTQDGPPDDEAIAALQSAFLLAAGCGAAGLGRAVRQRLTRAGLDVPQLPQRTSLTTTERRIIQMTVDGAFDQEIAQALFITPPTVRQTLDAVRKRLGVTSSQQLADAASR